MPTKHEINRSFLSQLNEPERSEALENYDEEYADGYEKSLSIEEALSRSFEWSKSKQGYSRWDKICEKLEYNAYPFKTKTMKHEVILNKKQPKQMTITDAPNGCYLTVDHELTLLKTLDGQVINLETMKVWDKNCSGMSNPCRILETGESITINIK
jgi:hypothetical protein